MGDESFECGAQPLWVRLAERHERTAAALDVERGFSVEKNHPGANHARSPRPGTARPGKGGAVGLSWVRRCQDECLDLIPTAPDGAQLTQSLDCSRRRKLGSSQAFDEVAAAADPEGLESAELAVNRSVPTAYALTADPVSRHDSLTL